MSRGDELRQLAAQLSVLAALEDTIAVGLSRGHGSPPVQVVAPFLLSLARLWLLQLQQRPQHLQQCPRPAMRWRPLCCAPRPSEPPLLGRAHVLAPPAPMPKRAPRAPRRSSSVASGLRGSVALAESGLVTGLATKSCPPVPPPPAAPLTRCSCSPRCLSWFAGLPPTLLDPLHPPLRPPRPLVPRRSASSSDGEWDALLDAHGLTSSFGGTAARRRPAGRLRWS